MGVLKRLYSDEKGGSWPELWSLFYQLRLVDTRSRGYVMSLCEKIMALQSLPEFLERCAQPDLAEQLNVDLLASTCVSVGEVVDLLLDCFAPREADRTPHFNSLVRAFHDMCRVYGRGGEYHTFLARKHWMFQQHLAPEMMRPWLQCLVKSMAPAPPSVR